MKKTKVGVGFRVSGFRTVLGFGFRVGERNK